MYIRYDNSRPQATARRLQAPDRNVDKTIIIMRKSNPPTPHEARNTKLVQCELFCSWIRECKVLAMVCSAAVLRLLLGRSVDVVVVEDLRVPVLLVHAIPIVQCMSLTS